MPLTESERAQRRVMIATLNQQARDWLKCLIKSIPIVRIALLHKLKPKRGKRRQYFT